MQPEDVLPGDIDANLGAPWIPESDIQAFAADLFGVEPSAVQIGHLKKDAVWSVERRLQRLSRRSPPPPSTARTAPTASWLLEQALNLKTPTIYDMIRHPDGREERRRQPGRDPGRPREAESRSRSGSRPGSSADPERTERLVRLYNDTYNNLRLRAFDGSHLDFPGMNRTLRSIRTRRTRSGAS